MQVASFSYRFAELYKEAGLPDRVLNVVTQDQYKIWARIQKCEGGLFFYTK